MRTNKIVHIISGDLWAGAEVQVYHTLKYLNYNNNMQFYTILFNDGILNINLKKEGIKTIIIDEKENNTIKMIIKITKLLYWIQPNIIHVHAYKEHLLGSLAAIFSGNKAYIVRTFHGITNVKKNSKGIKTILLQKIEKFILNRKSLNIIAVSKDIQKLLEVHSNRAKITQIYNAVDSNIINIIDKDEKEIREIYNIKNNTFWIGSIARLEKTKNLELLIDVAIILKDLRIDYIISIWGEGRLKNKLQEKINKNKLQNHVRLEGFESNILPVIKALDVCTLCSLHEGMPMSILEAITLGTPVVCTEVGGVKELIMNYYNGILVRSNDKYDLANAFIEIKNDVKLKKIFARNSQEMLRKKFDIKNTNKKLLDLYEKIIFQSEKI